MKLVLSQGSELRRLQVFFTHNTLATPEVNVVSSPAIKYIIPLPKQTLSANDSMLSKDSGGNEK